VYVFMRRMVIVVVSSKGLVAGFSKDFPSYWLPATHYSIRASRKRLTAVSEVTGE